MVPKVTTSESSRACFEYDLRKKHADDQPGLWLAGTVFGTAREMAKQMAFFRKLRPDCKRPIISFSLSLPPNDGRPKPEKWERMVERFLEKMGVDTKTHGWAAHEHVHENPHVHIRLCRIGSDGKLWNQENSAKRAIKVCAELEEEFHLEKHDRTPSNKKRPTMAEIQMSKRKGIPMPRVFIQEKVDLAIKNQPGLNFQELQNLLINDSIDMQPYAPNGLLIGVSYLCGGIKWPGSKIGRAYSAGLTGRGVVFTPNFTTDASEAQKEKEVLEVLTSKSQPVPKTPAMLKPFILPAQYGAKEIRPHAAHQTEVTLNSEKYNNQVVNLQIGPAAKVMLLIGGLLAQASVFLIQKILAFLKRLLAAFGFGMRQADLQKYEHPDRSAPALCYEPSQLSLPAPKSAEDKVADELFGVADALEKNDSSLLPVIDGEEGEKARAEVVSAMDDQGGKGTGATTAESENFGFTDEDFTSTNTVSEPPKADPLDELKEALAAHEIAARELKVAEIKNGPIHFSSVDQRQDELKIVREDLESAHTKWDEFCTEHPMTWRLPSAEKARLRQIVVNNELAETRALQSVAAAEAEDARIKKLYATLPAAIVPAAILQAEAQARQAVKTAREAIQVEGVEAIKAIRSDIMMSLKMSKFESLLSSSFKHFNAIGKISADEVAVLNSQISELRRLKNAQEAARRAAMAEFDGDANKPVVDGQAVK